MVTDTVYNVNTSDNSWSIDNITVGTGTTTVGSYTTGGYYDSLGVWHPYYNYYPYTYWWPSYPTTIYKYQIKCPRCGTFNWLELEKIEVCRKPKCGAKLKAVTKEADFEVPVSV